MNKEIKFQVIAGGIQEVKNQFKSVQESARSMQLNISQMHERTSLRIVEIERNKANQIKRINSDTVKSDAEKAKQILQLEERISQQLISLKEKEALKLKHLGEKVQAANAKSNSAGMLKQYQDEMNKISKMNASKLSNSDMASKGGFNGLSGILGIGKAFSVGTKGDDDKMDADPETAALEAGLKIANIVKEALQIGFQSVLTQASYIASSFLSAISQIGGTKNLTEMLVESAEKEKQIKATRFNVDSDERLSQAQIAKRSEKLAANESLGGFGSKDWVQAIATIGGKTGKQKSISQSDLEFIGKVAHVGNFDLSKAADIYGTVMTQNKGSSSKEIQQLFLDAMKIGQSGSFTISELPEAKNLIQASKGWSGGGLANTKSALGIGSILKGEAGISLDEAGTELERFGSAAKNAWKKGKLDKKTFGKFFDDKGQITDIKGLSAEVGSQSFTERAKSFGETNANRYLENITKASGVNDDDTKVQQKEKIMKLMGSFDDSKLTIEEFNKMNKESISSADRLKRIFNELSDKLETSLKPVLDQLIPIIDEMGQGLGDQKTVLADAIIDMINAMMGTVPAMVLVGDGLFLLGEAVGKIISAFGAIIKGLGYLYGWIPGSGKLREAGQGLVDAGSDIVDSQAGGKKALDRLGSTVSKNWKPLKHIEDTSVSTFGGKNDWVAGMEKYIQASQKTDNTVKENTKAVNNLAAVMKDQKYKSVL